VIPTRAENLKKPEFITAENRSTSPPSTAKTTTHRPKNHPIVEIRSTAEIRHRLSMLVFDLDRLKVYILRNYLTLFSYPADFITEPMPPPEICPGPGHCILQQKRRPGLMETEIPLFTRSN
jgi:hypothetical protein